MRLVADTLLRTPPDAAIVTTAKAVRTVVACADDAPADRARTLERAGVSVWRLPRGSDGVDLELALRQAADEGLLSILAEGGAAVAGSLLNAELVDRVAFFIAPRLYGADAAPALPGLSADWWRNGSRLESPSWTEIGGDCLFEADVIGREGRDWDVHGTR